MNCKTCDKPSTEIFFTENLGGKTISILHCVFCGAILMGASNPNIIGGNPPKNSFWHKGLFFVPTYSIATLDYMEKRTNA